MKAIYQVIQAIKKTIFCVAFVFIAVAIFALTVGQILPFEFADNQTMHKFYDIIMQGLPIAILLTLFGTIKLEKTKAKNLTLAAVTVVISIASFFLMVNLIFTVGFGSWKDFTTIYRHKTDNKEIKEQLFDVGALGYGRRRIVEIKPVLNFWILPTEIDTTTIDKNEWTFVNEDGDIKSP